MEDQLSTKIESDLAGVSSKHLINDCDKCLELLSVLEEGEPNSANELQLFSVSNSSDYFSQIIRETFQIAFIRTKQSFLNLSLVLISVKFNASNTIVKLRKTEIFLKKLINHYFTLTYKFINLLFFKKNFLFFVIKSQI